MGGFFMEQRKSRTQMIKNLLEALLCAWLVTGVLLLILAVLLWKMNLREGQISVGITVTYLLSCFAGGWFIGRKTGKRRFLSGLLQGICYFLLLLAVSMLAHPGGLPQIREILTSLALCAAGGMAGGMLS